MRETTAGQHLWPSLGKQRLQDKAVSLQGSDHVREGLGACHQQSTQHHAQHALLTTQLSLQPLLGYPGQYALAHHLVLHLQASMLACDAELC